MSNRSLAAARSRRTPNEVVSDQPFKKQPPQGNPQQKPSSNSQKDPKSGQPTGKLSVSDAIGLITIRLSKLEYHMLKEQSGETSNNTHNTSKNVSSTDVDTVMRSLVSRISSLEKSQETHDRTLEELNLAVKDLEENPVPSLLDTSEINTYSSPPTTDPILLERLEKNEKEISELKQLVIRLQTMFIETTMLAQHHHHHPKVVTPMEAPSPATAPATAPTPTPAVDVETPPETILDTATGTVSVSI
jgi:hypothetical protein